VTIPYVYPDDYTAVFTVESSNRFFSIKAHKHAIVLSGNVVYVTTMRAVLTWYV